MKILISNDDGVYAQGIQALSESISTVADVLVVAPDRNRSGASNSLTLHTPLRAQKIKPNIISVEGTPTDCVHLALTGMLEDLDIDFQPDLVISGINDGYNVGDDVLYSGTVAAAMEGRMLGVPSIAFSMDKYADDYTTAAMIAKDIVVKSMKHTLPDHAILNVNIPKGKYDDINEYVVTRHGTRHIAAPTIKDTDPRGQVIYWIGPPGKKQDAGDGTDFYALAQGKISITPLQASLTDEWAMKELGEWVHR